MPSCPTCGHDNADLTADLVDRLVDWDDMYYLGKGSSLDFDGLGTVKLIVDAPGRKYDSYGGGIEEDVFVVVEVQGRLFKKEGSRDSYGGVSFDFGIREVKGEPKTITVFDYV